jgi:cysteinyl-tRNA synthetase
MLPPLRLRAAGFALAAVAAGWWPAQSVAEPTPLQPVHSWAYQLQGASPTDIAASPFDLVVIDYSRDGTAKEAYHPDEVQLMQRKAGGGRRVVLSYLSIGEAEEYRFYWDARWKTGLPAWLGPRNPDWPGNYKVRFWDPEWQALMFGRPEAYLDQIMASGFDGLYLDVIDAYEYYQPGRPTAAADMVDFVLAVSAYAKSKNPDFLIFPQNGEALLKDPRYLAAIDGIGKEDLFYSGDANSHPSSEPELRDSLEQLRGVVAAGKLVLSVEYLTRREHIRAYRIQAAQAGFLTYVAARSLDALIEQSKF